jgi:hypothetical protein
MKRTNVQHFREWVVKFFGFKRQMSRKDAEFFIQLMRMNQRSPTDFPPEAYEDLGFQVIKKRAEYIGLEMSDHVIAFIAGITKSPGAAIMFVYAIRYKQLATETGHVNMDKFAEFFPFGYPDENDQEELWSFQKTKDGKNMLDLINPNTELYTA